MEINKSENRKNKLLFPSGFLWGVATSAYQVEGGNSNSDWWQWEKEGKADNESGIACDYWNRYESDHELLSELGCGAFRLGIEWARVEPEEGKFDQEAIEHYRAILQDLKKRNIKTQVTLWHWTSPSWFQEKYGLHKKDSAEVFVRYAEKITQELGDLIDMYITFNEPMVPLGQGFLAGSFPPGFMNPYKFICAVNNIAKAHRKTYERIHQIKPDAQVGITYLYNWYESEGFGILLNSINRLAQWYRIDLLGNKIRGFQDYIGIDYYRLGKIKFDWRNMKMDSRNQTYFGFTIEEDKNNVMKWISYPEGMYKVLKQASKKFKLPIYITENGTPTRAGIDDDDRIKYIKEHLASVQRAINEGVDVSITISSGLKIRILFITSSTFISSAIASRSLTCLPSFFKREVA
ncbi:MAG: Beta-glucosidase [Candidatus Moranbacteria bacterium GW2011_GWD2_38_7]|nr:MAG: Beta-glucosidase [Candidatus Moranbacteria bacterium GW2011_GWD2_38_7]